MNTADLNGDLLDRWVARAQGRVLHSDDGKNWNWVESFEGQLTGKTFNGLDDYHPLSNWAQGGPVLNYGCIFVFAGIEGNLCRGGYMLYIDAKGVPQIEGEMEHGTYLGAGLKAFVHQVFGPTVDDDPDWSKEPELTYTPLYFR